MKYKLNEWLEWLALNILGADFYYSHTDSEIIKEVLKKLKEHPARSWGWSWVSILDLYYHDIPEWEELSKEEKQELCELLFDLLDKADEM